MELKIIDSLEIDHLGRLWLTDYDSISEKFLGWGKGQRDVLILSKSGEVQSRFDIPLDGPNKVGDVTSRDFKNGEVRILEFGSRIVHFDIHGEFVRKIDFPFFGFHLNGLAGDPYYEIGEELAFVRPEKYDSKEDVDWDELYESGFQRIYQMPILEVLDTISMKTRLTMEFPKESMYQDGNFYGWMFPTVIKNGKDWILFFRGEMKFYHYREIGDEVVFSKTIDLKVSDAVPAVGVPFQRVDDFFDLESKTVAGRIYSILPTDHGFLAMYKKGVREDELLQFDLDNYEVRKEMESSNPYFLAFFDSEFNLIQNDINLPEGIVYSNFLSPKGNLMGLKDQDYFGVEEEKVVYYELELETLK
ncbi:hypothetical protein [Algoriphagus sp. PAP.12]|uniref:hypothetical protein n=1 Tax=Algoriphagus sp. PAP.12 TaxID=2996678 RepID=UPI00227C2004|nr:hypothetical protein [Algoriphagus sp. PAP.12]